jgi:hypothetical protein
MQSNRRFQASSKMQKSATNFYLFLVALYLLLASAHLINILIHLTVGSNIGPYFEFINTPIDRVIVYTLNFVTMLYITIKPRKVSHILLFLMYVFVSYFVFLQIADMLIILVSFVALAWLLTSPEPFSIMKRRKTVSLVAIYLILILAIIEISALTCWLIFPFYPKLSQEGNCKYLVDLETKMFLLAGCLAPVLTVLFLFSWVIKLLLSRFNLLRRLMTLFPQGDDNSNTAYLKKPFPLLLLACSIVLSFLVTFYPYMPGLNADMHPIGVDFPFYEEWLMKSSDKDFFSVFTTSFFGHPDRPLSLLILYLAKCASGVTASSIAQFFPLILGPVLVLSVYSFMREVNNPWYVPSLTAFLSVASFHISVGIYGFFLSNWMALIELYLFMGFYFSSLRKKSCSRMATALLLSICLLFTHSWTWGMAIGILFVYLLFILVFKRKSQSKFEIRILIILILVNVLVCIIRNYTLGWAAGDFETLKTAEKTVSTSALGFFWDDLLYTFLHTMYGFFVNPMALLLAVLGGLIIAFDDKPVNRYLTSWLVASSLFFVLGSGSMIKSRILLNIPLPVFESLGLIGITRVIQRVFEPSKASLIKILMMLLVLLVSLNYVFRCAFVMSQL